MEFAKFLVVFAILVLIGQFLNRVTQKFYKTKVDRVLRELADNFIEQQRKAQDEYDALMKRVMSS